MGVQNNQASQITFGRLLQITALLGVCIRFILIDEIQGSLTINGMVLFGIGYLFGSFSIDSKYGWHVCVCCLIVALGIEFESVRSRSSSFLLFVSPGIIAPDRYYNPQAPPYLDFYAFSCFVCWTEVLFGFGFAYYYRYFHPTHPTLQAEEVVKPMFYTFDHTADIGLVITAPTLPELFAEAGRGFFSLIVANLDDVRRVDSRTLVISGEELEYRLFDFLNELLYLFEHEHWVGNAFEVSLTEDSVSVTAWGEPLDRTRHRLEHEVKAVTYHGLLVEQRENTWYAEVIFDI